MPQLEIPTIISLSKLFETLDKSSHHVSADHEAHYMFELYEGLAFYKRNGFKVFDISGETCAFVKKGKETIKLVTGKIKPFTAYRVLDLATIDFLEREISMRNIVGGQFQICPHTLDTNDYRCLILRHITNDIIRFFWEREKKVESPIVRSEEEPPDDPDSHDDNNPVPLNPNPEPPVLKDAAKPTHE